MIHFSFSMNNGRTEGTKKPRLNAAVEAREQPIRFAYGEVNRVRRIGAFFPLHSKKQPWDGSNRRRVDHVSSGQCGSPQPVGISGESKSRWCSPLFCRVPDTARTFRGPNTAARSDLGISPFVVELASYALPRFGQPSARRMAGEVSEHGRKRPGAGHEANSNHCRSPLSGKRSYARSPRRPSTKHTTRRK